MRIRQASLSDCPKCRDLANIKELEWADGFRMPVDYFEAYIKENRMFLIAEVDGKILGFVLGERITWDIGILNALAVDHTTRGKGIGTELVRAFEKECARRGVKYVELHASKINPRAGNFYQKLGYGKGLDLVEYVKELE